MIKKINRENNIKKYCIICKEEELKADKILPDYPEHCIKCTYKQIHIENYIKNKKRKMKNQYLNEN